MLLPRSKSVGLLVQEEKQKIDFQDGAHRGDLGFLIGTILAIFALQVTRCFLPSFKSIDFQDGGHSGHLGFWIGTILAILALLVTQMLPIKFQYNSPFSSEEEAKNRFSRYQLWQQSWIFDRDDFNYF